MGESHENLLKAVKHCQESLDKYTESRNDHKLLHYLERLYKLPIKVVHLEQTGVGRTVNGLRKLGGDVGDSAKGLVAKWKQMVVGEQEEEDDDDEDEDDEEDEEDGYQSGEEPPSNDSDSQDEKPKKENSSSRKGDSYRTDEREAVMKNKHSASKSDSNHSSDSSKYSKKEKDRYKHNGHAKHKSHKRRGDDSSSEDQTPKKRSKHSEDEDRHKSRRKLDSDSEDEPKSKEKKHKLEKHKSEHKARKLQDSSSDFEDAPKPTKSKEKHRESSSKDKHKSSRKEETKKDDAKKHEQAKKTKEKDKKSKDSGKVREKSEDKKAAKSSKVKTSNGGMMNNGIDSGSGASFAEALGMLCEASSSKNTSKKKPTTTSEKKDKPPPKVEDPVPKLLKESHLEPIDLNISSLLPPITPNYRPLGNLINSEIQAKKWLSESEALTQSITSKNQRTKVYSGNKMGNGKVSSLFELCIRVLQDNIDALEYTGGVPYSVLKPILEKSNPNQLYMMEHHNPYLIEDTDELWQLHCQKEFRNKKREELETWREMYLRCLDERDAKLKALTANIKQSQDKSLPVRMTKLAYVDAVAKPPRNIARKQAKNGTAAVERKPSMTPSARLNSLATAGDAGKVAVPNPGSRAVERSSSHQAAKPKKAPLMLKSISSFKNRFKR